MGLYKRKGSSYWWYRFQIKGCAPVRSSAGTSDRQAAEQAEAEHKRRLWEQQRLGVKPTKLWEVAVVDYLEEMADGRNKELTKSCLLRAGNHLRGRAVSSIDKDALVQVRTEIAAAIRAKKAAAAAGGRASRWAEPQPSSINRNMGVVGAVLHHAGCAIRVPFLTVPKKEKPWATREKALKLIGLLPKHQIPKVIFALEVGWRRHNITHLAWPQVDLARRFAWITPEAAKEGRGIPTPLSDMAVEVLRGQLGLHEEWVFPYRGKPVTQTSTLAYRAARDAAGLPPNFTWHSLRHTWASWMLQDGAPEHVLMTLGGWADGRMLKNYTHLGGEHLRPFVRSGLQSPAGLRSGPSLEGAGPADCSQHKNGHSEEQLKGSEARK